jgi:hypothetical protein
MPIDCNALCKSEQETIHNLIGNNVNMESIQQAINAQTLCITDCERRIRDATMGADNEPLDTHRGSGRRKKYIGKTKNRRSRTQRRKKTQRRQRQRR